MRSKTSITSRTRTSRLVSSCSSRATPCCRDSPISRVPPGMDHCPRKGSLPRRISSARPSSMTTPPIPTTGLSGYSRAILIVLPRKLLGYTQYRRGGLRLTSCTEVYNTPDSEPEVGLVRELKSNSEDVERASLPRMLRRNRRRRRRG